MNRRNFLAALAGAPLAGAIELKEAPRIIYAEGWVRSFTPDPALEAYVITDRAKLWVSPFEREEHARLYAFSVVLTYEQMVDYPTILAQTEGQMTRQRRAIERDLLTLPPDWHGRLRRRTYATSRDH